MKVVVDDISYTFRQFLLDKKNIYSLIYFFMIPIFFSTEFFQLCLRILIIVCGWGCLVALSRVRKVFDIYNSNP